MYSTYTIYTKIQNTFYILHCIVFIYSTYTCNISILILKYKHCSLYYTKEKIMVKIQLTQPI